MLESRLIKSYGNVLLKTFARKNSYSENCQEINIYWEISFLVMQPATLSFSLTRFSLFWLYSSF